MTCRDLLPINPLKRVLTGPRVQEQIPMSLRVGLDAAECERILLRFLKDYAADAGRARFVLGLSGGLDSAVSAALAVRAVGAANVHGLILPAADTPSAEAQDAEAVAKQLGIQTTTRSIGPFVDVLKSYKVEDRMALGNSKARFRMVVLHAEAAARQALVLGTGNKSELLTGYFTKFGDGGVDVQPLGDLYKTQVRLLARHLGVVPAVIDKPPTAGFWQGQTDETELGITYETLDRILLGLELKMPLDWIAKELRLTVDEVGRIERLRRISQHKRRMAMVPKIGLRTVGIDWRTPTLEFTS